MKPNAIPDLDALRQALDEEKMLRDATSQEFDNGEQHGPMRAAHDAEYAEVLRLVGQLAAKVAAGLVVCVCLFGCVGAGGIYRSHANAPHDGAQWHSCADGMECREGWACVRDGCEICGDPPSRCSEGIDG